MDRDEKIRQFNKQREREKDQLKVSPGKIIVTTLIVIVLMPVAYIVVSFSLKHLSSEFIQIILGIFLVAFLSIHWNGNSSNE